MSWLDNSCQFKHMYVHIVYCCVHIHTYITTSTIIHYSLFNIVYKFHVDHSWVNRKSFWIHDVLMCHKMKTL